MWCVGTYTYTYIKIMSLSTWHMPAFLATWKPEAGGVSKPRTLGPAWEILRPYLLRKRRVPL